MKINYPLLLARHEPIFFSDCEPFPDPGFPHLSGSGAHPMLRLGATLAAALGTLSVVLWCPAESLLLHSRPRLLSSVPVFIAAPFSIYSLVFFSIQKLPCLLFGVLYRRNDISVRVKNIYHRRGGNGSGYVNFRNLPCSRAGFLTPKIPPCLVQIVSCQCLWGGVEISSLKYPLPRRRMRTPQRKLAPYFLFTLRTPHLCASWGWAIARRSHHSHGLISLGGGGEYLLPSS